MNSSEKKSINKLLTIGFILSFFFCISGLVVSIIGIVKAKKNNIKDITLGVVGIILSVVKLIFIPFVVLLIVNFDDYKEIITNKYNEATEACESGNAYGYDCKCGEFDEYCTCIKCYDDNCHAKVKVKCPNKERNIY